MNTDKDTIQQAVEQHLAGRLANRNIVPSAKARSGQPTVAALREQAAFLAGAMAALHAVFGEPGGALTDYASPKWVFEPFAGRLVVNPKE